MSFLPTLNAILNATSAIFLLLGFSYIKKKKPEAHKRCMLAALCISTVFLASYVYYHFHHGATGYQKEGFIRLVYFSVLISHTVLAMSLVYFVPRTFYLAFRGDFERHRRIARWAFPIWLYVSVTGVVVYWMLYRM